MNFSVDTLKLNDFFEKSQILIMKRGMSNCSCGLLETIYKQKPGTELLLHDEEWLIHTHPGEPGCRALHSTQSGLGVVRKNDQIIFFT